MREIALVTRVTTHNKGNQALSAAWVELLREAFPGAPIRAMERAPRHLARFSLRQIAAAPDPVAAFDAIAGQLAALAPGPGAIGAPGEPRITLQEKTKPFAGLRRRLNLRRMVAAAGTDLKLYKARLAAFQRAGLVVMNPAGEFHPGATDIALMYLLDIRVAQKLGCRTAVVNLSLETMDPALSPLIAKVFSGLDLLHLRDEESRQAYASAGGDPAQAVVAPDLALATPKPAHTPVRIGAVGLGINGERAGPAGQLDEWTRLILMLQAQGLEVVLVSNAVPLDRPFYEQLQARTGVHYAGQGLAFQAFAELLAGFELVVTMRMHTGIIALAAGRPVIPVEPVKFKMAGLFRELGFAAPPVSANSTGWADEIVRRVTAVRSDLSAAESEVAQRVALAIQRTRETLIPRLRAAAL